LLRGIFQLKQEKYQEVEGNSLLRRFVI